MGERDEWLEIYDALVGEVETFQKTVATFLALMRVDRISSYELNDKYAISFDMFGEVSITVSDIAYPIIISKTHLRDVYNNLVDVIAVHKIILGRIKDRVKELENKFNKYMDVLSAVAISKGLNP